MITVEFSGVYVGSVCLNEDILAELYLEDDSSEAAEDAAGLAQDIQNMLEKKQSLVKYGD